MTRPNATRPQIQTMTVIAQDPGFRSGGRILTTLIDVPAEQLGAGPTGARVKVIDYDASTGTLYKPARCVDAQGRFIDLFKSKPSDTEILNNPSLHAQNTYAIVMSTLARFERALGRRVSWGFGGHQLFIAPHAFCETNAFYSEENRALLFGYFPDPLARKAQPIYACLSFDVVAHECTHAILDGLRDRFTEPSSLAQDAFHEGFADVVALLSVLASKDLVAVLLAGNDAGEIRAAAPEHLKLRDLKPESLKGSALVTLAKQMGQAISGVRGKPLRASLDLPMDESWKDKPEFNEPHRHGELLVAAILHTFADAWYERIKYLAAGLGRTSDTDVIQRDLAAEEGASAAATLLTILIRAIDYTAPTHITFEDYLSAVLTADVEVVPDDTRYNYRRALRANFEKLGFRPAAAKVPEGTWERVPDPLHYDRVRFESILRDPEEAFRFLWDNRRELELEEGAYTRVESVRPAVRVAPDGILVRETVAEYTQRVTVPAGRLAKLGIRKPPALPDEQLVTLWGGGTLVLDEYAHVKFHVRKKLLNRRRQQERLQYLADSGYYAEDRALTDTFARLHLARRLGTSVFRLPLPTF